MDDRLPGDLMDRRVLVVDDSDAVRSILTDMLERFGLAVESVGDGRSALRRLEEGQAGLKPAVELVVLDWRMPDLDGVETLRRLRALPGVPVPGGDDDRLWRRGRPGGAGHGSGRDAETERRR